MGKKIEELDKCVTLMEKTNRLFVTGVIDLETKDAILETCKLTAKDILTPVVPTPLPTMMDAEPKEKKPDADLKPDVSADPQEAQGRKKKR